MNRKIIVVGSTNMDMVVTTHHIPNPGETVLGGSFFMNPGGKGANQAVAISRLGGDVTFVSKIGNDIFGKQSAKMFDDEGVDIRGIKSEVNCPSGIAMITVDEHGENSIVVAPGANASLSESDVEESVSQHPNCAILLVQLEIPIQTVAYSIRFARERNIRVILNPAPVNVNVKPFLDQIDIITPNVTEAEMLSGCSISDLESAEKAAVKIKDFGVEIVVITLGSRGALLLDDDGACHIPAPNVDPVDTTAAGDVFNGALAVAIAEDKNMRDAVTFACKCAAISVTRMGAQSSIPYRNDVLLTYVK